MAINKYDCEICNEEFCADCQPSLVCSVCSSTICQGCENPSENPNYAHDVVCVKCMDNQTKEKRKEWERTKFQKKSTGKKEFKIEPVKGKMDMTQLQAKLESLKYL